MKSIFKFDVSVFRFVFAFWLLVKFAAFFYWKTQGDSALKSDADYYESFALNGGGAASSAWPEFLRFLHYYGFFDRFLISCLIFFCVSVVVPLLLGRLVQVFSGDKNVKVFWFSAFVVSLYPSLIFVSLDIFRDGIMVLFFLMSIFFVRYFHGPVRFGGVFFFFFFCFLCFMLRGYLGLALIISLFVAAIFCFFDKVKFKILFLGHILVLFLANYAGLLSPFHEYRGSETFAQAGSSLGLTLEGAGLMFFPYYLFSFIAQVLGVFYSGYKSILAFLIESLFIIFIIWRCRNMTLAGIGFERFYLLVFSVVYASVFVLANDNLGTALRLRMYIYLALFIVFFSFRGIGGRKYEEE